MSEENKELVRRYYRALNAYEFDAIADFYAEERLGAGVGRGFATYQGAFPDLHLSIEELIAEDDKVVCRSIFTGTQDGEIKGVAPTGRAVSVDMAEIYRVKDGKFVSYWCQTDVAGMLRQLTDASALASAMS